MDVSLLTDLENGMIDVLLYAAPLIPLLWSYPIPDSDYVYGVIGLFPPDIQKLVDNDRLAVIRAVRAAQQQEGGP